MFQVMKSVPIVFICLGVVFPTAALGDLYKALSDEGLGISVSPESTDEELLRAYQQLTQHYPPDESDGSEVQTKVLEVQDAWEVLGNPELRKEYDLSLQSGEISVSGDDNSDLIEVPSSGLFDDDEEDEEEEPDCE